MAPATRWAGVGLAVAAACAPGLANAGYVEGSYRGSETWVYLDRFVFNPVAGDEKGRLEITLDFPETEKGNPALMLYYKGGESDGVQREFGFWERAYNTDLMCEEKALIAQQQGGMYLPLPGGHPVQEYVDPEDGTKRWNVTLVTNMHTSRARWLFVTVGNCLPSCGKPYCSNALDFRYTLSMTNGDGRTKYFSADKTWFLETSMAFAVLYSLLACYAAYTRSLLVKQQKYHHSVRLLVASVACSTCSMILFAVLYSRFADTGIEEPRLEALATVLSLASDAMLLLMTILVAKGWTIVRRKISAGGRVRIAAYMTVYVVVSVGCWVYYLHFTDPAAIVYIYSTVPGVLLVILRLLAFGWFSYAVFVTLRKYRQKRAFYRKYWFLVGAWILSMPVIVAINGAVDVWVRAKIVNLLTVLATFICHAALVAMYNPALCGHNASFPFHATTNTFMKSSGHSKSKANGLQGGNTFEDAHLMRAFQLSSQMRHTVVLLQTYTNDLYTFLDNVRGSNTKPKGNAAAVDRALSESLLPTQAPEAARNSPSPSTSTARGPPVVPDAGSDAQVDASAETKAAEPEAAPASKPPASISGGESGSSKGLRGKTASGGGGGGGGKGGGKNEGQQQLEHAPSEPKGRPRPPPPSAKADETATLPRRHSRRRSETSAGNKPPSKTESKATAEAEKEQGAEDHEDERLLLRRKSSRRKSGAEGGDPEKRRLRRKSRSRRASGAGDSATALSTELAGEQDDDDL